MKRRSIPSLLLVCSMVFSCSNLFAQGNCAEVTGFTLIQDDQQAGALQDGDEVSMHCNWNAVADVACDNQIKSVEFRLNGSRYRVENEEPYALGGNSGANFYDLNLNPGTYTLKAIPWSKDNATGTQGTSLTITFTVTNNSCGGPGTQLPDLALEDFADGFSEPTDIASAGDDRLFIVEKAGKIRITDLHGNKKSGDFLDISSRVNDTGSEQGLLGLAFDPDYSHNKYFYVYYTDNNGNVRLSRFHTSNNPNKAESWSEVVLLMQAHVFANHNAGQLRFRPDGYLYVAIGDGGGVGDTYNNAQNPSTFLGKLLRIDVSHLDPGNAYTVPASNPFVGENGWLEEIWATGLRNPFRFSFDAKTGDLWIGDVGQNAWEEIDFQPAGSMGGENYGWSCMEGNHFFKSDCNSNGIPYTAPIAENAHVGEDCGGSIIGGFVYRGLEFPNMYGKYFYTDFCTGILSTVYKDEDDNWANEHLLNGEPFSYSTFGEDKYGELYLANITTGEIYHVVDGGSDPAAKMSGNYYEHFSAGEIGVELFPNPNNGEFTVEFNALQKDVADVRVLNQLGQEVWFGRQTMEEGVNKFSIASEKWQNGIYTLQILTSEGEVISSRFMVAR